MATKIIHKKSSVAAKVPLATDLEVGELAVNLVDKKIYSKQADGTVVHMLPDIPAVDGIQFDTTGTGSLAVGQLAWNSGEGTLDFQLAGGNVTLQVGQEMVAYCKNATGTAIPNGSVVYISGSSGQKPQITLASAADETTSSKTFGITTETIAAGANGYVTTHGIINHVDTSAYAAGTGLWLSTTAGQFTSTRPAALSHGVFVGWVVKSHAVSGSILLHIQNGYELNELHDVLITTPSDGQVLAYEAATGLWKNSSAGAGAGTVTSVAATAGTGISVTGSPITTSGTLTITNTAPNVTTDLTATHNASTVIVNSSDGTDATINAATTSLAGVMSATDKTKLDGIDSGAEVNQNAFTTIAVAGQNSVVADAKTDTLTLASGTGITITTADTTDTITITNSAPDQTVSLTGSGATTVTGTYPNFTISSTDTNTTYSAATSTVLGLVELFSDTVQSTAANAVTSTASRTYGIQVNGSGQLVVNVPWTETNTSYSAGTGLDLTTTTFSLESIAAGSTAVGAVAYNGTTKAAGKFDGGTTNPSNTTRLNYDGNFYVNNLQAIGNVNTTSDERLKTNWSSIDASFLDNLVQIKHGTYDRLDTGARQAGVSAQDLQKILPEVVSEDEQGLLSVNYGSAALVAVIELTKLVKELQKEIEKLKAE